MTTRGVAGVRERLERSLERWQERGAAELGEAVGELLGGASRPGEGLQLERLKPAVYRLKVGSTPGRALIAKRHPPAVAQTDRLVVERWLPALDLGDGCPQLLAAAAEREGSWVWHVYEDLGDGRSEEHTSELQSQSNLVCRLLLEKKKESTRTEPYRHHTS